MTIPAAPTGLAAAVGAGLVDLSWTDNATDEDNYVVERSPSGIVPTVEAQSVLDRMSGLSKDEENAIVAFVNGCVSDGTWANIHEFWGLSLNATDYLTGFKTFAASEMQPFGTLAHRPAEGVESVAVGSGYVMQTAFNALGLTAINSGALFYFTDEGNYSTTSNMDYCGLTGGTGAEAYMRNRAASNSHDINALWSQSSVTPRPATVGLLHEDVCGFWTETGAEINVLYPGGVTDSASRTAGTPNNIGFGWSGRNSGGVPQNAPRGLWRCFVLLEKPNAAKVLAIRARINQFLTDVRSGTADPGWTELETLPADTESYQDRGLGPDETWFYRVAAENVDGRAYSNIVQATTLDAPQFITSHNFRMTGFGHTHERNFDMTGTPLGLETKALIAGVWTTVPVKGLDAGAWVDATVEGLDAGAWTP